LRRATLIALAAFCTQVLLGALNVWLGKHASLVVAHLTLGTLVWCSLVWLTLTALAAPRGVRSRSPRTGAEAVPA
jgi:heme A synthase